MRLQPHPLKKCSAQHEDLTVRDRRRGSRCDVDIGAAALGPMKLQPETTQSDDPAILVKWFCKQRHPAQESQLEEAIAIATQAEQVHRTDDAWPHGLADQLGNILDCVFAHQQREQAVVFPMLLKGLDALPDRMIDEMIQAHEHLLAEWRTVSQLTGGFSAPAHACAAWLRLYALCSRLQFDCVEQVGLENRMLLAGRGLSHPA